MTRTQEERIAILETQREEHENRMNRMDTQAEVRHSDLDARVRLLELFQTKVAAYATLGALAGGAVVDIASHFVHFGGK